MAMGVMVSSMARSTNEASVAPTSMLKKPMVAAAAIGYYGGQVRQFVDRAPAAPTMLHFGAEDPMILLSDVEGVAAAHPGVPVHVYEGADHGFNCDARASYHPASAELAQQRTLNFLRTHGVT